MKNEGFDCEEVEVLSTEIESAFVDVERPSCFAAGVSQDEFESWYKPDKFYSLYRDFYNYDKDEVHYLMQYAMKAYLKHYGKDVETDVNLNLFLLSFSKFEDDDTFIRERYSTMYGTFDAKQRRSICSFLTFIRLYEMDDNHVDEKTIEYWCRKPDDIV